MSFISKFIIILWGIPLIQVHTICSIWLWKTIPICSGYLSEGDTPINLIMRVKEL